MGTHLNEDGEEWAPAMAFEEALPFVQKKLGKHLDLVWYARSTPMDDPEWFKSPDSIRKGAWEYQMKVEERYPEEVAELACQEHGNWHHGFNSGVVAGIRYLFDLLDMGQEHADGAFPCLDS